MGTLKKLRFKLAWRTYRVGDVIEPNGTLAGWLVNCGFCEAVEDKPAPKAIPQRQMVKKFRGA